MSSSLGTSRPSIPLKRLHPNAEAPSYQTEGAAGMDLHACLSEPVVLAPGARALIPTGWACALPPHLEAQVRPRSGLAVKSGVTVLNSPGTIDSDYRGEIKVLLINLGPEPFTVTHGLRMAQLVVAPVVQIAWQEVETLPETVRGAGGFGHTGH